MSADCYARVLNAVDSLDLHLAEADAQGLSAFPIIMQKPRGMPGEEVTIYPGLTGRLLYRGNGADETTVFLVSAAAVRAWIEEQRLVLRAYSARKGVLREVTEP